ncbi:MAG: hypothetical protein ACREDK_06715 [Thermoplasmata archaeon]
MVRVEFDVGGAGELRVVSVEVPRGSPLKVALRAIGQPPEGCAVLLKDVPVPLDLPLDTPLRFTVVRTFSGG